MRRSLKLSECGPITNDKRAVNRTENTVQREIMMTKHQPEQNAIAISTRLKEHLGQLFSTRREIEKVIVFGSRARGDADARSDIDLAIVAPTATTRQWLDISFRLEDTDTLLTIDIVRWEDASATLKERIIAEGKVLYERHRIEAESHQS